MELEAPGQRAEVTDHAEWLLPQIIGDHPGHRSAEYTLLDGEIIPPPPKLRVRGIGVPPILLILLMFLP